MEDDPQFRGVLRSMGYEIQEIEANADNLYKAISIKVYGTPFKHQLVRTEIAYFVAVHENDFAYIQLEDGRSVRNPTVKNLFPNGTWEMKRTLAAASLLYGIVVVILTADNMSCQYPEDGGYDKLMTLSYHFNNHFNVLTQQPRAADDEPL